MSGPAEFDWHAGVREFADRRLASGRFADLPPHVRQRVIAVVDPARVVLGYVEVELDGSRSATGSAVFVTDTVLVSVTLDGVPHEGVGAPIDVEVRFLADLVGVAVTGFNDGWAPNQWQEPPTGQYRLTFADGGQINLPIHRGAITIELRALVIGLTQRR